MAIFNITAQNFQTQDKKTIIYDSTLSTLKWEDGSDVINDVKTTNTFKVAKLEKGKSDLKTLKIQLGLSCNFECEYCNQRYVPRAEETNQNDIDDFLVKMDTWYTPIEGSKIEFWGGEPLVYWKTLKPLAEKIRAKYPDIPFTMVTNGSLLDKEKNKWLDELNFSVGISHDGPGQFVRGPDPLDDPESREGILDLYKTLAPKNRTSFNSMVNSKNKSRAKVQQFFIDLISKELGEEYLQYLIIGEGSFIDAYDEDAVKHSLTSEEEDIDYRNKAAVEIRENKVDAFQIIGSKGIEFIKSIQYGDRIESLGQKCGMDKKENMAVDLKGNVLTCQNVSPVSHNPSGISHLIGNVDNLNDVEVKTGTHWSDREECPKCPVIHICKGACFYLTGDLWETTCNNAYSDNIIIFCNVIETLTGYFPIYIDGPLREDRKDIFWIVNGKPDNLRKPKKVIEIKQI